MKDNARALLAPEAAGLPQVAWLTVRDDVTDKIVALKPDLILDYNAIAPRYVDLPNDAAAHEHSHRDAGWISRGSPAYSVALGQGVLPRSTWI